MQINKNFKIIREELKLTQQDAAVMIGVSRITYIKYEENPDTMPIGKYEALMEGFDRFKKLQDSK